MKMEHKIGSAPSGVYLTQHPIMTNWREGRWGPKEACNLLCAKLHARVSYMKCVSMIVGIGQVFIQFLEAANGALQGVNRFGHGLAALPLL